MKKRFSQVFYAATLLLGLKGSAQDTPGMRSYYERARDTYLEAARQTNCPERAAYLRAMAQYEDCVAGTLAGKTTSCIRPSGDMPPCNGDMLGAETSGPNKQGNVTAASVPMPGVEAEASQSAATAAFQGALEQGKKPSGAVLQGMLSAARQTGDPKLANAYAGTGLIVGGLMALGERHAMKKEQMAAAQNLQDAEDARQTAAVHDRKLKQDFANSIAESFPPVYENGPRRAVVCWIPLSQEPEDTQVYVTDPMPVYADAAGDFPLKDDLYQQMAARQQELPFNASHYQMILFYPLSGSADTQTAMNILQQEAMQAGMQLQITQIP